MNQGRSCDDGKRESETREIFDDATLLILKMEGGSRIPGVWAGSWKRQGVDSPLEPPGGSHPCQNLDFRSTRPILDF